MGSCPCCGADDPHIEGPQPDRDGMYRVCVDCGYLADDLARTGMIEEDVRTGT